MLARSGPPLGTSRDQLTDGVVVSGSRGLIGSALGRSLEADGHRVIPLVRPGSPRRASSGTPTPATSTPPGSRASMQWCTSPARASPAIVGPTSKASHPLQPRQGHDAAGRGPRRPVQRKPAVLGQRLGDRLLRRPWLTPSSPRPADRGVDFLAEVCQAWEASTAAGRGGGDPHRPHPHRRRAQRSTAAPCRSSCCCSASGSAARPGRGRQWFSWITLADEIGAIRFLLDHDDLSRTGRTSPRRRRARNAEFTKALGRVLHRPTVLRIPRLVAKLPLGVGDLAEIAAVQQRHGHCRRRCSTPATRSSTPRSTRRCEPLLGKAPAVARSVARPWPTASPRSTSTER